MKNKMFIKLYFLTAIAFMFIFKINYFVYANDSFSNICDTLIVLDIIENNDNLDDNITRSDFSKMVIKMSKYKDTTSNINYTIFDDVPIQNQNSAYIKKAVDCGFMNLFLGGYFKPDNFVNFNDISNAMLALLEYNDEDFAGNKVSAKKEKFISLGLDENVIDISNTNLTKRNIIKVIYNTMRTNIKNSNKTLAESNFQNVKIGNDNEIEIYDFINNKLLGPYIVDKNNSENFFSGTYNQIFLNGINSNLEEVRYDFDNYAILIYYRDNEKNDIYVYSERADIRSSMALKRGYIESIEYSISDMLTPDYVVIDNAKYNLASNYSKLQSSYTGNIKIGDYVLILYNKIGDVTKFTYSDDGRKIFNNDDIGMVEKGAITYIYKLD